MIIDSYLKLAAEQAVTASAATESYIDLKAAGDAIDAMLLMLKVDTSADSSGDAATVTLAIQTDDNASFSSPTTLATTGALAEAVLTSGTAVFLTMPKVGLQRYLRGYFTVGTENLTAGAFTVAMVKDGDLGTVG